MSFEQEQIFQLYNKYGNAGYIGESVSQVEHALQCARLAEFDGFDHHVILASLFHDLGHLLTEVLTDSGEALEQMIYDGVNYGVVKHEKLGADFLRKLGVPEKICFLVENHIAAKRYLVFKDKSYYDKLSGASKQTLIFQGGVMSEAEAIELENNEMFNTLLKIRVWDDLAKDSELNLSSNINALFEKYKKMLADLS